MLLVGSAEDLVLVVDSQGERQLRSLRDTGMGDRLLSAIGCEVRVSQYNFMGRRPVTGYRLEFDVDGSAATSVMLYGGSRVSVRRPVPAKQLPSTAKRMRDASPERMFVTPPQWVAAENVRVDDWICSPPEAYHWHNQSLSPALVPWPLERIATRIPRNDIESRLRICLSSFKRGASALVDPYGVYLQVARKTVSSWELPLISLAVTSCGSIIVNDFAVAATLIPIASATNV